MAVTRSIENLLKRDRTIVTCALVFIAGLSWLYVLSGAGMGKSAFDMSSLPLALGQPETMRMDVRGSSEGGAGPVAETMRSHSMGNGMLDAVHSAMATAVDWSGGYALLMFFMWWAMMIAMMLPSAAPVILLHAVVDRKAKARSGSESGPWPTAAFTLGYLFAWAAFSAIATISQWTFEGSGLLSTMMMSTTNSFFAGTILAFVGFYQLTPIKQACLRHCRGPIEFLSRHWRPGTVGALQMGVHHGAYCLGCCWGLMAILFFGGVMNLYWIIGLALIVLFEKLTPLGPKLSFLTGGLLLMWSATFFYRALA